MSLASVAGRIGARSVAPAVGLILVSLASCRQEAQTQTPVGDSSLPNILLISVDALRPDHLGCYGYDRSTSPRIDKLAADGALFENAISSTSWTLPAHAALFTGLADSVHGCVDTDRRLAENRQTLAERLKNAGYATVGFFSGPYLHPVFGLGQGFDEYVDCTSYPELTQGDVVDGKAIDKVEIHEASHRDVTNPQLYEKVSAGLRAHKQRPFFMFVHMWDVHFDFIPPPPYDTKFDPEYQGAVSGTDFLFDSAVNASMPRRDLEHVIALYDGEIAWTDEHIGRMLDDLDALGLRESTIVVLVSDHGTEFFEHGRKGHRQSLYDEVIRIPMIIRFPGRIEPGRRYTSQVRIIDVLPTIMDLAGLGEPADVMGQSLVPLWAGAELRRDTLAVSELFCDSIRLRPDGLWERKDPRFSIQQRLRAFRRSDRKLINDLNRHATEVFDLSADAGEQRPLEEVPGVMMQDVERAREWLKAFRQAWPTDGSQSTIPPEVLAKLKSLGYIGGDEADDEPEQPAP